MWRMPEYIPDGYTMDGEPFIREPNRLVRIAYRNEDGGLIRFNQMFKGGTKVDTEDAYTETFQLNGHDALDNSKRGNPDVIWVS